MAKIRVAPLNVDQMPRLELDAAVLGVQMANTLESKLTIKFKKKVYWSHSTSVLCWVYRQWDTRSKYLIYRTSEIFEVSRLEDWRYVQSALSVADDATKWSRPLAENPNDR